MPYTHQKTVTVFPLDDSYSWSKSGDSNADWVTISNAQNNGVDTDTWDFLVADNPGAERTATCTVTHSDNSTTESFTITQSGLGNSSPSVTTNAATGVANADITLNGTLDSDNGNAITSRGFYLGTNADYTQNTQIAASGATIGSYSLAHTVSASGDYYYTAYAVNSAGIGVGTTLGPVTLTVAMAQNNLYSVVLTGGPANDGNPSETSDGNSFVTMTINADPNVGVADGTEITSTITQGGGLISYTDFVRANSTYWNNDDQQTTPSPFVFTNNVATLALQVFADGLTEGPETFAISFGATDSNGNNTNLADVTFTVSDDSTDWTGLTFGYNDVNSSILLGQPTTVGNIKRYIWDNATVDGTEVGPNISIIVDGLATSVDSLNLETNGINLAGTFYWSNDSDGATNDTLIINNNYPVGKVWNTAWNDTDASNGVISGEGTIDWIDGTGN